ncbi:bifunctional lysylphosphatidylglycerol flippase/synthetase MprF [Robbsia andropogonis]|uniref:bifunctional lysylphosphatidylglycerol flippase/synthetase MprF n=1 Tax=Robbsia andropogonis TaxID=28092 RepID=UPI0036F3AC79
MKSPEDLTVSARAAWRKPFVFMHGSARRFVGPLAALALCVVLLVVFQHILRRVDYPQIVRELRALSLNVWAASLAATAVSYVALVARDWAGLRYVGATVSRTNLWIGASVGSALGNVTGFGALTGGAVRLRVYGANGVQPAQVGRLTAFTSVTLALTLAVMTGAGMLFSATHLAPMFRLTAWMLRIMGGMIVLAFVALVMGCGKEARAVRLGATRRTANAVELVGEPIEIVAGFDGGAAPAVASPAPSLPRWMRWFNALGLSVPARNVLLAEMVFSIADVVTAGLALWVILPHADVGFINFVAIYAAALLLGMIGHTPGGLGVFEAAMAFALGRSVPLSSIVGALLAYRVIYFVLPLLLSAALLAVFEGRMLKSKLAPVRIGWLAPVFLSTLTFAVGSMLVLSGAVPAYKTRLSVLKDWLPLWVLESSQILASLFGVLLLFVARGLLRRLDGAWWLATIIVSINLALSVTKGLAFFEAGVLLVILALLLLSRRQFNRSSSLFAERFTFGWMVSVGIVLALSVWLMFYAFRNVPYTDDLWSAFAFDERAPRALRTVLGAVLLAAALSVWQLLRPARGRFVAPPLSDIADAGRIVRAQPRSDAGLAMMGDKSFLFSKSRKAFLMYAKRGRTWAALHDPVGARDEWAGLIREFVALAHAHGGRAAFYQVRAEALPLYLDAGLTLVKLGEEAQIDLHAFEMTGPHRANLRYAMKRGEKDGLSMQVVDKAHVHAFVPTLRRISDTWLDSRSAKEKSFSVAAFTPEYLASQSVIVISQNGLPVAFSTFMTTDLNEEATIGVMRHLNEASPYTMEYLFTSLALHLKKAGLRTLSLGMSPLSGMTPSPLASPWFRLGALTWRFGGRFYNFRGLRAFKNKFTPQWEPRYLAASGSVGVLFTLADLSLLAGGWRS